MRFVLRWPLIFRSGGVVQVFDPVVTFELRNPP
jgi:hypothetical protein